MPRAPRTGQGQWHRHQERHHRFDSEIRALWVAHPLLPELQRLQALAQGEPLCGHGLAGVLRSIES